MVILSFLYRYGIWISVLAFVLFIVLHITCITGVVRTVRQVRLFGVPLVDRQEIEFMEPGKGGPLYGRTNIEQTFREAGVGTHGA